MPAKSSSRRLFTNDELDYFKRALKLYSEMGWPLDYQQIRCMFSHAAPPPMRVGNKIVMNGAAVGRAIVIDAAIENSIAAPFHESR
mmetsp:Transcript_18859/g.47144  ORF Transcript_18859/g.47144 Transcript_18859/m.47144 type:complete len:86 (+) Transcript_18859:850-1107(+)